MYNNEKTISQMQFKMGLGGVACHTTSQKYLMSTKLPIYFQWCNFLELREAYDLLCVFIDQQMYVHDTIGEKTA